MTYPLVRPRRLRRTPALRRLVAETRLHPADMILPLFVKETVDNADVVHVHDEWTRKKFDTGKYKSGEIYGSPRDPKLRDEYQEYLKKRLEEIRNKK